MKTFFFCVIFHGQEITNIINDTSIYNSLSFAFLQDINSEKSHEKRKKSTVAHKNYLLDLLSSDYNAIEAFNWKATKNLFHKPSVEELLQEPFFGSKNKKELVHYSMNHKWSLTQWARNLCRPWSKTLRNPHDFSSLSLPTSQNIFDIFKQKIDIIEIIRRIIHCLPGDFISINLFNKFIQSAPEEFLVHCQVSSHEFTTKHDMFSDKIIQFNAFLNQKCQEKIDFQDKIDELKQWLVTLINETGCFLKIVNFALANRKTNVYFSRNFVVGKRGEFFIAPKDHCVLWEFVKLCNKNNIVEKDDGVFNWEEHSQIAMECGVVATMHHGLKRLLEDKIIFMGKQIQEGYQDIYKKNQKIIKRIKKTLIISKALIRCHDSFKLLMDDISNDNYKNDLQYFCPCELCPEANKYISGTLFFSKDKTGPLSQKGKNTLLELYKRQGKQSYANFKDLSHYIIFLLRYVRMMDMMIILCPYDENRLNNIKSTTIKNFQRSIEDGLYEMQYVVTLNLKYLESLFPNKRKVINKVMEKKLPLYSVGINLDDFLFFDKYSRLFFFPVNPKEILPISKI